MARLFALALLLAPLPLAAQDAPPAPATPPPAKTAKPAPPAGRITGTVLCADTHRPARSATVMLAPLPSANGKEEQNTGMPHMSRVALDGSFSIDHVSAGEYSVLAFFPGYLSALDDLTSDDLSGKPTPAREREILARNGFVTVHGAETETLDISLERGASVSGHVLYSDGSPASQVSIQIQDVNSKPPKPDGNDQSINPGAFARSAFMHQPQFTDDQGRFRISGLKPGSYRIVAVEAGPSSSSFENDLSAMMGGAISNPADLHIYAGDTLHKKSAKVFDLAPAAEVTGVDITIPLDMFHRVHGTLSAKDGRPINGANITLTDTADDAFTFKTTPGRDGSFAFATVPPGTYTIAAADARILSVPEGMADDVPLSIFGAQATNAFADASTSIIVKDSDLTDVSLTLAEVPLPPQPTRPNNPQPIPDDQPEPEP